MSSSLFAKAVANAAPKPQDGAAPGSIATNAQKARALMAMVQDGGAVPDDIPPERLRDWARDLVRTVEGARPPATPPTQPARKARLFTHGAPTLSPPRPGPDLRPGPPTRSATAPTPLDVPGRLSNLAQASRPASLRPEEVTTLISQTLHPDQLAGEHPAVIAVTLMGKAPLEQAAVLRGLHGSQARVVHRALRRLEQGPFDPAGAEASQLG